MRKEFSNLVEAGRVREGYFGSEPGERCGLFHIRHPFTKASLKIIACADGFGWDHVSVSTQTRCPTWWEMQWVKEEFFEPAETAVQFHVPNEDRINEHAYCLHLWRPVNYDFPMPPKICV